MNDWQKHKRAEKERKENEWYERVQREREERAKSYSTTEAIDELLQALVDSSDVLPCELIERVQDIQERLDHDL